MFSAQVFPYALCILEACMKLNEKLQKLTEGHRDAEEMSNWIFSLTPLGVAFIFYFIFLLPMDIENKNLLYVIGAAAGFSGLQAYWIYRGWRRNDGSTVLLGLIGIMFAVILTWAYVAFINASGS